MSNRRNHLAALALAALSSGCASGGGSGGDFDPPVVPDVKVEIVGGSCGIFGIFDLWGACGSSEAQTPAPEYHWSGSMISSKPPFTSWSALPSQQYGFDGASYQFDTIAGSDTVYDYRTSGPEYDGNGQLLAVWSFNHHFGFSTFDSLQSIGSREIDFVYRKTSAGGGRYGPALHFFSDVLADEIALVANPYKLDWNYQSFGIWASGSRVWPSSFGVATPASAVPPVGQATFTGKLAGLYVSPGGQGAMATAEVSVHANFSARTLALASTGSTLSRDARTATAAPNLNLSGTLAYSPASNTFSGTLTNTGGTMSGSTTGRYYGPAAQELGGVFTVKSATTVETFAGAYGAKR